MHKYSGQPVLEKEAFKLKPGELSSLVQIANKYVILLCEGRSEGATVDFAEVRDTLSEDIYEKKLRIEMAKELEALKNASHIDNLLAGTTQTPKRDAEARPASAIAPRPRVGSTLGGAVQRPTAAGPSPAGARRR